MALKLKINSYGINQVQHSDGETTDGNMNHSSIVHKKNEKRIFMEIEHMEPLLKHSKTNPMKIYSE
jgi:hypothetical protein